MAGISPESGFNEPGSSAFDAEAWRREHPMDYFWAARTVMELDDPALQDAAFRAIFKVCRLHVPPKLFKYYALDGNERMNETKLSTLSDRKVYTAEVKDLNDPFDCRSFYYRRDAMRSFPELEVHDWKPFDDIAAFHRVASFTECAEGMMPMWAHYANNHRGYCVEYNMEQAENRGLAGLMFPVQYSDRRVDLTDFYKSQIQALVEKRDRVLDEGGGMVVVEDLRMVYLPLLLVNVKHSSWSYEREHRCTIGAAGGGDPYVDAWPKAVYIGKDCNEGHRAQLARIARKIGVPAYQMGFNDEASGYLLGKSLVR